MVHAAIERIQPGEIVVIAMPEVRPVALVGELLAVQMKMRGAAAVLVDGAVRDVMELRQLGLPIWSRHIRARGATKAIPGALDARVEVAGAAIEPGDILVLGADGAVCVPVANLGEVAKACEARIAKEASLRRRLLAGERSLDIYGLQVPGAGEGREE